MKKILLGLVILSLISFGCGLRTEIIPGPERKGADIKVTDLPAEAAPDSGDLTVIVHDPLTVPVTKKATLANIAGALTTILQPYNANLTIYAAITPSADVQTLLGSADQATLRINLGLIIGTNVLAPDGTGSSLTGISAAQVGAATAGHNHLGTYQPLNANLTGIAALSCTEGQGPEMLSGVWTCAAWGSGGGAGYSTILDEGVGLAQRSIFNFIGSGITAVDNPGSTRTDISIHTSLNNLVNETGTGIPKKTGAATWGIAAAGVDYAAAVHNLIDTTNHPVTGLTTGHFLKALSGTTYGFAVHGLSYTDVGAAASAHVHTGVYQPLATHLTELAALVCASGEIPKADAGGIFICSADSTGGTPTFDTVATGTNTTATMTVGAGATVTYGSTGIVNARQYQGIEAVTATEFGYISGVTSPIQTQFTGKAATIHNLIDTTNHPVTGLTGGYFLKALTPTTYGFAVHGLTYTDVGAAASGHDHSGTYAPIAHAVNASTYGYGDATNAGHLRVGTGLSIATGTISVAYGTTGTTAAVGNDARLSDNRTPLAHVLNSASHTVSGLTTGHFLKATGAATFGFAAHGLTYTDVGAAATSHAHAGEDITSGSIDGDRLPALSTTKKGGVPATATPSGKYLRDDDTWATPIGAGDLLANGTVPLTADWDMGNFGIIAKSFDTKKTSGTAGTVCAYTSSTTDIFGICWEGDDTHRTANLLFKFPNVDPTANQVMMFSAPVAGRSTITWGTPATTALKLSDFAATTSAELATIISDENGTGKLIFSAGTLNVASGKTLTVNNNITLTGTDGITLAIGGGGTLGSAAYTAATAYQPIDGILTSLSALTVSAGSMLYGSGATDGLAVLAAGATTAILVGGGAAAPVWTTATGSGAPARGTSPILTTASVTPQVIDASADCSPTAAALSNARVSNYGQTTANVSITGPTLASGMNFIMIVGTTQAGNYWRYTSTGANIYLDAGTAKTYIGFAAPAVGNSIACFSFRTGASDYSLKCTTLAGTSTSG
jgi:hypothetical protein